MDKNSILREVFPHLKLKDKDSSWLKKVYIYLNIVAQLWVISVICLYLLLPYLAQDVYTTTDMTFYQNDEDIKRNANDFFEEIQKNLEQNKLYANTIKMDIYLLNDKNMYFLFNPIEWLPNRQTFAVTHNKTVFVCNADIAENKAYASSDTEENLDAILVHEAIHVMQNSKYGWLYTTFRMPYWVKEGYPIYSARNLSVYKEKEIIEYMTKTNDVQIGAWSIFEQDQFYGLMVKHAIVHMHKSVDDLHLGKVDYDEVLNSLLDEYNISKT